MGLALLFAVIASGLLGIAYSAWRNDATVIALAALVLSLWMGWLSVMAARRGRAR